MSYGAFRTDVVFDGKDSLSLQQMALSASLEYRLSKAWTISASAGGLWAGRLVEGGVALGLGPGGVASVAASWMALEQAGARPFVMGAGSLAASVAQSEAGLWVSADARVAVMAGYTLADTVSPYLVARAFGGPIFWRGQVGTDRYHYQLGAGVAVGLPGGFDASAELVPLGEQRVTVGVGRAF